MIKRLISSILVFFFLCLSTAFGDEELSTGDTLEGFDENIVFIDDEDDGSIQTDPVPIVNPTTFDPQADGNTDLENLPDDFYIGDILDGYDWHYVDRSNEVKIDGIYVSDLFYVSDPASRTSDKGHNVKFSDCTTYSVNRLLENATKLIVLEKEND